MAESRRLRTQADEYGNIADDCGRCTLLPSLRGYVRATQVDCPVHGEHPNARRLRTQAERDTDGTALHRPCPRIVVDPAVRWGRPHIEGTHAATVDVAGMVAAGESIATVADEYGLTRHQVLLACWHEGIDGHYQALWADWATGVHEVLAGGYFVNVLPDPPADPDIWMRTESIAPPRRRWWHRYTRRTR